MKKARIFGILAALLVAASATASLTACGGEDSTPSSEASSEVSSAEVSSEETSSVDDYEPGSENFEKAMTAYEKAVEDETSAAGFAFAYIDKDDVPELIMSTDSTDGGMKLYHYTKDGKMKIEPLSMGDIYYKEQSGYFVNHSARMDGQTWKTYTLIDDEITETGVGSGYVEYDADTTETYDYDSEEWMNAAEFNWKDESVTREEFEEHLNELYPFREAETRHITESDYFKTLEEARRDVLKLKSLEDDKDDESSSESHAGAISEGEKAARQQVLDKVGDDYSIVSSEPVRGESPAVYKIGVRGSEDSYSTVYFYANGDFCLTEEEWAVRQQNSEGDELSDESEFHAAEQAAGQLALSKAGSGSRVISSDVLPSNYDENVFKVVVEDEDGNETPYYSDGEFCMTEEEWLDYGEERETDEGTHTTDPEKGDDESSSSKKTNAADAEAAARADVAAQIGDGEEIVSCERTNSVNHEYAYMIGVKKKGSSKVTYYFATDGMTFSEEEWYA